MTPDKLKRLLTLTADNKSPVIQELRQEVVRYVNFQESVISSLEIDNFAISHKLLKTIDENNQFRKVMNGAQKHEALMRELLRREYAN